MSQSLQWNNSFPLCGHRGYDLSGLQMSAGNFLPLKSKVWFVYHSLTNKVCICYLISSCLRDGGESKLHDIKTKQWLWRKLQWAWHQCSIFLVKLVQTKVRTYCKGLVSEFIPYKLEGFYYLSNCVFVRSFERQYALFPYKLVIKYQLLSESHLSPPIQTNYSCMFTLICNHSKSINCVLKALLCGWN